MIILNSINAQVTEKYESQTIYLQSGGYVKDGKKCHIGFFGEKLKKEMVVNPEALNIYEKFQRQRRRDLFFVGVMITAEFSALFIHDRDLKNGVLLGGLANPFVTIPFGNNAGNNLYKAIWTRNRDVLK
jgi:hypothetical protein